PPGNRSLHSPRPLLLRRPRLRRRRRPPPRAVLPATPLADSGRLSDAITHVPAAVPAPVKRAPPPAPPRVVTAPRRDASSAAPGRLFVNATPWGQVFVDDELIGNTPRIGVPIGSGKHRVRVSSDGFESFERTVQVAPGQDVRLTDIVLRESKP